MIVATVGAAPVPSAAEAGAAAGAWQRPQTRLSALKRQPSEDEGQLHHSRDELRREYLDVVAAGERLVKEEEEHRVAAENAHRERAEVRARGDTVILAENESNDSKISM